MNKVCLVGRLTKDPTCEYVNTNNGSVARARKGPRKLVSKSKKEK